MQDTRSLQKELSEIRSERGVYTVNKNAEAELRAFKATTDEKRFRIFPYSEGPQKFFMLPLDLDWSPARVMLLMDRKLGIPPFKGLPAYSDGAHSAVAGKIVVEKACTIIPNVGLFKLFTMPLPHGERGKDEAVMWQAVDLCLQQYVNEHPEEFSAYLDSKQWPGGRFFFRPGAFVRDAGGGGWNGIRLNYNGKQGGVTVEQRLGRAVVNEEGCIIEQGCDLHVMKSLLNLCAKFTNKSEEKTFKVCYDLLVTN